MFHSDGTQFEKWFEVIGGVLTAVTCTVMIAATVIGLLGVIGVRASAELADVFNSSLAPIAQQLLIVSLWLIVFGMLPRGWLPVALSVIGGILVYLAMFILPTNSGSMAGMSGIVGTTGMSTTAADPFSLAVFWAGVALLLAAFVVAYRH